LSSGIRHFWLKHLIPNLLQRALDNVLRNGLRFCRARGCVQVSFFKKAGTAIGMILIQAGGDGVPAGKKGSIFEAFVTLKQRDSRSNSGYLRHGTTDGCCDARSFYGGSDGSKAYRAMASTADRTAMHSARIIHCSYNFA